jgi:hypothetical protein
MRMMVDGVGWESVKTWEIRKERHMVSHLVKELTELILVA